VIVDTHVHVFTDDRKTYPQVRDTARAGSVPSIADIGQIEWPLTTVEILVKEMDRAGVDKATLVQSYYNYEYDNRYTEDSALKHPGRFTAVVILDPMAPGSPDELSRLVKTRGVTGLRFMRGRLPATSLGEPATFPLWERVQALRVPVAVNDRIKELPKIRKAMERYPDVKVSFEHAWGHHVDAPPAYPMLEPLFSLADLPNVHVKTAVDNIVAARKGGGTPEALYEKLVRVFGARRIMWSSNYPAHPEFGTIETRLKDSQKAFAFLGAQDRDWVFGKTALAFYPALA
jgi:predicted TIM-barrel fold metal-dependent hydrolase